MVLIKLFVSFFKIGLFAIGGAYSFIPLLEAEIVEKYGWLTKEEFLEVLGLIKVFPGAISIKYATYTGYKIGGILGAVVANLGNFLAPILLVIFFGTLYWKHKDMPQVKGAFEMIQLVVFAMILATAFKLIPIGQLIQLRGIFIICIVFGLFIYTKIHPAIIIVSAGFIGAFLSSFVK